MSPCLPILLLVVSIVSTLSLSCPAKAGADAREEREAKTVRYAIAEGCVPVTNNPDLTQLFGGSDGDRLSIDECGNMRALEFVALPGTVFTIEEELIERGVRVFRVNTAEYPYLTQGGYYVDARLVRTSDSRPPQPRKGLPSRETILSNLVQTVGSRYIWGGNCPAGISRLLSLYPPSPAVLRDWEMTDRWMLRGVDCSGLLYQATSGYTPRNTSSLLTFGKPVKIAGLSTEQIARTLLPLDLIVWKGHVLIVLDKSRVIESRLLCKGGERKGGVMVTSLSDRLTEIMAERRPSDDPALPADHEGKTFVVRRWYLSPMGGEGGGSSSDGTSDGGPSIPPISELPPEFAESSQLLQVSGNDPKSICATLRALEREDGVWRPVFWPMKAVIGRGGFAASGDKREGDGKTPTGVYPLGFAFGYGQTLDTRLRYVQLTDDDVWIDDPAASDYNRMVKLQETTAASFERMLRDDGLYRYGLVVEYNMNPVVKNLGSAIFFHVRQGECVPTVGCIALSETDLLTLLHWLDRRKKPLAALGNTE